jgi:serine/threonine protein kinase
MTEREIFIAALQKSDPADRAAFLDQACADDQIMRARVGQLLQKNEQAGSFLEAPAPGLPDTGAFLTESLGSLIGPYKLLEKLGEGGMGTVWIAEREQPKHRVALKLIKPGMDSKQIIRRFDAERQALALMSHNNIAKMLDAGTTESGGPYFVMELVKGVPITKYCDETHASVQERLNLFIPVCLAVQHAHQKGIIHRDIKPSNVLVCIEDGKPVPKVIDFGVAKALHQPLTEGTLHTAFNQVVGTLEYMSPEQAELNALDIDTRADIYALGVLLFELLTGSTPITRQELKQVAVAGMLRKIKETEPRKPSTRLSESKETIANLAALRRTDPSRLMKDVRGDLDWIVLKCLESDRTRRYETANALAREIERHLSNESVEARPPTARYRLSKFVRRNKGPVLAAVMVLLALIIGVIGTTWQMVRANDLRDIADEKTQNALDAAESEKKAKITAEERENETKAVLYFVSNYIFAAARQKTVERGLGPDVKLADAVKAALPFIEKSFTHQPLIEARLRNTVGLSFQFMGDDKNAIVQWEMARTTYTKELGVGHQLTLETTHNLANSYAESGQSDIALKIRLEVLDRAKETLGPHHWLTLRSMDAVGMSQLQRFNFGDAIKTHEDALKLMKEYLGSDHPDTLRCMLNLANDYIASGRQSDGVQLLESALGIMRVKIPNKELTLNCMNNLANVYRDQNRHADCMRLRKELAEIAKVSYGSEHPTTLVWMLNLASEYHALERITEAIQIQEFTLPLLREKLGPDHRRTLLNMDNLATCYRSLKRFDDAAKLHKEVWEIRKKQLGLDHPDTVSSMDKVAVDYYSLSENNEALKLFEEARYLRESKLGRDHIDTLTSIVNLALCYSTIGKKNKAIELLEPALPVLRKKYPTHNTTLNCMQNLAKDYKDVGRTEDALKLEEELLPIRKTRLGVDHRLTLVSMNNLALTYRAVGRNADALKLFEELLSIRKGKLPANHDDILANMTDIALCYRDLGRYAEAAKLLEETLTLRKAKLGPDHPNTLATMDQLAVCYGRLQRYPESIKLLEQIVEITKHKLGSDHIDTLGRMVNLAIEYNSVSRPNDAIKLNEEALSILRARHPDHSFTFNSISTKAEILSALERYEDSLKVFEEALAIRTAKLGPNHPDTLNDMSGLAWLLANCPNSKLRDPSRALELAKQAVKHPSNDPLYLSTLGLAYYRTDHWKEAITTLMIAVERNHGAINEDGFLLAMAHWQLGHDQEAKKWFAQTAEWMDKNKPQDKDLTQFRAEAAALMKDKGRNTSRK